MIMEVTAPALNFPAPFCCNCGAADCTNEMQETRVTRFFRVGGSKSTFSLPVPVCAACRRTTRRRPSGFFTKLLVTIVTIGAVFLALLLISSSVKTPMWISIHLFSVSVALALVLTFIFYRLRRSRPPQTSFYQPVRIRVANLEVSDVTSARGTVVFMKLAFTNPEYLAAFRSANQVAIDAGRVAAVKA